MAGFLLGSAPQLRGAHYMSQTLWTAWFYWAVAAMVDMAVSQLITKKRLRANAQVPKL